MCSSFLIHENGSSIEHWILSKSQPLNMSPLVIACKKSLHKIDSISIQLLKSLDTGISQFPNWVKGGREIFCNDIATGVVEIFLWTNHCFPVNNNNEGHGWHIHVHIWVHTDTCTPIPLTHTHALPNKHTPKDLKVEELVEKWKGREMEETE